MSAESQTETGTGLVGNSSRLMSDSVRFAAE